MFIIIYSHFFIALHSSSWLFMALPICSPWLNIRGPAPMAPSPATGKWLRSAWQCSPGSTAFRGHGTGAPRLHHGADAPGRLPEFSMIISASGCDWREISLELMSLLKRLVNSKYYSYCIYKIKHIFGPWSTFVNISYGCWRSMGVSHGGYSGL